jgi:signal peptidase I
VSWEVATSIGADLSFIFLLVLQKNLWLSRLLGLRVTSHSTQVGEAAFIWLFGIVALLFRSTQATQARPSNQKPNGEVSVAREIAETVVFVVVLVLLLKAFVAQAFVIPTGSMAVTLYGYQMDVTCPQCGITFPVNASNEVDPSDGGPPVPVESCVCPNCRYHIDFREEMRRDPKFERPSPSTGDRVLVADFLYDLPGHGPKRLDVVVFKYPGDSSSSAVFPYPFSGPQKQQSAMNYIKRLTGLGGETIGIWYGKLYYLPADQLPPGKKDEYRRGAIENIWNIRIGQAPQEQKEELRLRKARGEEPENWEKDLWRRENMFDNNLVDQLRAGVGFQIIRKPPAKILEMRRIVYDNDHPPKDLRSELRDRWTAEPGTDWSPVEPHGFHAAASGGGTSWLRYKHVLRTSADPHRPELITDFMGYNTYSPHRSGGSPQYNWVGDLLVECEVAVEQPSGTFTLELSKGVDRFRATWDLSSGTCTLSHLERPHPGEQVPPDDHYEKLATKPTKLHGKGKYQVRFANIDDRLLVWVDDELPFGDGEDYKPHPERGPYANDLQPASIGVQGASLQVRKLSLWRDTYYTRNPTAGADAPECDLADPGAWGPLQDLAPTTLYVQPGHYLCMGDNSPESSDGRTWGLVPERLMLGRALVVYYPFSRAGRIR